MKKKIISICTVGALLIAGCTSNNTSNERCSKEGDLNPNGSSELSIIMRKMAAHLAENRDALKAGKGIVAAPKEIDNLLTAKRQTRRLIKLFMTATLSYTSSE